jgi:hypothetical protein
MVVNLDLGGFLGLTDFCLNRDFWDFQDRWIFLLSNGEKQIQLILKIPPKSWFRFRYLF